MAAERLLRWSLALALLPLGCEPGEAAPRDQWVVTVATDAPVPQLGDRLRLQVIDDRGEPACSSCERVLGAATLEDWPRSFGVRPPADGESLWVRATLFRTADMTGDGLPASDVLLDALGRLPKASELTEVAFVLHTDCFGVRADAVAKRTCDPADRQLVEAPLLAPSSSSSLPAPGSWPPAQETPCQGEVPAEMVCVPGGAFVLGSPDSFPSKAQPERLVLMSPFALDVDEVTVGRVKGLGLAQLPREHDPDEQTGDNACTFMATSPDNDAMPANCLSYAVAQAICEAQGKRLPTEAEWEWAAGNRARETTYPWGAQDDDLCRRAVLGRGRLYPLELTEAVLEDNNCRGVDAELGWGPRAGGSAEDVSELGLRNLGGNLSEWVADGFADYDEPCWRDLPGIPRDPWCEQGSPEHPGSASTRGGSWVSLPLQARVTERNAASASAGGGPRSVGVRCALSMAAAR